LWLDLVRRWRADKEGKERAKTKHRGLPYQDVKAEKRLDATARHGIDEMCSTVG